MRQLFLYPHIGLKCKDAGWFKITNGAVDFGYTGLVYDEKVGWWYVENGAINFNYNGLKYNEYNWWKITCGAIDFTYTAFLIMVIRIIQ